MNNNYRTVISVILIIAAAAVLAVFEFADITFTADKSVNGLLIDTVPRLIESAALIGVLVLWNGKRILLPSIKGLPSALLWCIPCFFVVLANFPFTALIGGSAKILRPELIALFLLKCISIGLMEEILFRGLVQDAVKQWLGDNPHGHILTVIITSAVFAVIHIFNLFAGANVGATFLQVGYSFLIGAMLSAVLIKTGNIWLCVALHSLFDFGGFIVTDLGEGPFQDIWFWVFTAIAGVICFAHVLYYLIKNDREQNKPDGTNTDTTMQNI